MIASVAVATVLACAGTMPTGAEAKLFGRKEARTTTRGRVAWRRFATNQVARSPFAANIAQLGQTMKNEGPSCVETCAKLTEQSGPDNTKPCDSQPGCVFNHGDKTCISMISQSKDDPTTCPPHRMDDGMKGNQCNGEGLPTCYETYSAQHPDAFDENGHYTYPFYGDDQYDELYQMDEDDNNDKIGSLGQVHRNVRILAEQNDVYYDSRSSFSKLTVALGAAFAFASGFVARGVSRRRQDSVSDETRALGQSTQAMYGAAV